MPSIQNHYKSNSVFMKYIPVLLLFIASCQFVKKESVPIQNLLPRETGMPGWIVSEKPVMKTGEALKNYLSDRYELYQQYSISSVAYAAYRSHEDSIKKISVEIFSTQSTLNAFGIMSYERYYSKSRLSSTNVAFNSPDSHFRCKGPYYIRISSTHYTNNTRDLMHVAKLITNQIDDEKSVLPGYIRLFSGNGTTQRFAYIKPADPDISSLQNMFLFELNISSKDYSVLYRTESSFKNVLDRFLQIINDKKQPFTIVEYGKRKLACRKINSTLYVFITLYREYIIVIKYPESIDEGKRISELIFNKIDL